MSYHYCDTVKRNEEMVKYTKTDLGKKMSHIIVGDFNTENVILLNSTYFRNAGLQFIRLLSCA